MYVHETCSIRIDHYFLRHFNGLRIRLQNKIKSAKAKLGKYNIEIPLPDVNSTFYMLVSIYTEQGNKHLGLGGRWYELRTHSTFIIIKKTATTMVSRHIFLYKC